MSFKGMQACAGAAAILTLVALVASEYDTSVGCLEPEAVWRHFQVLCQLPRCSGNEGAAVDYVVKVAEEQGLEVLQDSVGNLVVYRDASGGGDPNAEPVIVQTHLDTACEGSPLPEQVQLKVDYDGWAGAENTSLGADSGVGIAVALAVLEESSDTLLPPIEALFTIQGQKGGFMGARGLNASLLSGRRLLNLDGEQYGVLFVGAAGKSRVKLQLPVSTTPLRPGARSFNLVVRGLTGGHSGTDIHLGRANALAVLARVTAVLREHFPGAQIMSFTGGGKDHAIPREASALLGLPLADLAQARELLSAMERELRWEFGRTDPEMHIRFEQPEHAADAALSEESSERLLDLLMLLPQGVLRNSAEISGSVETSSNLARVRLAAPGMVEVLCLVRSVLEPAAANVLQQMRRLAARVVATVLSGPTFPAWTPARSSPLLTLAQEAFRKVEGRAAGVAIPHTGLETAAVKDKLPDIDMVSYGPDVSGAHKPGECVKVESVEKTWELTRLLLARMVGGSAEPQRVDL